jgi:hypothetical protein
MTLQPKADTASEHLPFGGSHAPDCPYRVGGECLCWRSDPDQNPELAEEDCETWPTCNQTNGRTRGQVMAKTTLTVDIEYDPELTEPEGLASAMDRLLETALSTPGVMEDYGNPRMGEFFVAQAAEDRPERGPTIVVEIAGGVLQEAYASDTAVQLLLVDWDTEGGTPDHDPGIVEITGEDGCSRLARAVKFPTVSLDQLTGTDTCRALDLAGVAPRPELDEELEVWRRWVLYSLATDALLTARLYASYEDAAADASQVNDVLVLPLVCQGVVVRPDVQPAPHDPQEPDHDQP